jgi:hypothetical protein
MAINKLFFVLVTVAGIASNAFNQAPAEGFQDAAWGMKPAEVQKAAGVTGWQPVTPEPLFPKDLGVTLYRAPAIIAGYQAVVTYYFFREKFFQATVDFTFNELKNFDFNYNVFISVDRYYRAIHDRTLTFVNDIYDLLRKKYGMKKSVFRDLDPRFIFKDTDFYIRQEVWNLRYHPSEYYKRIIASAYAMWNFPKTRVVFSVNISAKDSRFDYKLSATSLDMEKEITETKDSLRMKGL